MQRQASPLIPDMAVSCLDQEYAIVGAAKSDSDIKQKNEGGKKCPTCLSTRRNLKIYGCLLSRLNGTPLELPIPKGYVYIYKQGKSPAYPEDTSMSSRQQLIFG